MVRKNVSLLLFKTDNCWIVEEPWLQMTSDSYLAKPGIRL